MIFQRNNDSSDNFYWKKDDLYAVIAFLLLSADGKMDAEGKEKLNAYMGLAESDNRLSKRFVLRDTIIEKGNAFLAKLDEEDRLDCIIDEIDRIFDGKDVFGIKSDFVFYDDDEDCFSGNTLILFNYMVLVAHSYSKNKKWLLKRLALKWDIDNAVLPILETSVETLINIDSNRLEIQNSNVPYKVAVSSLSNLDAEEDAVWEGLNALGIVKNEEASEEEDDGEENCKEDGFVDKAGDVIVDGIMKVGEIICAPFDWLTEKITGWM
jgi:hypothetical protein